MGLFALSAVYLDSSFDECEDNPGGVIDVDVITKGVERDEDVDRFLGDCGERQSRDQALQLAEILARAIEVAEAADDDRACATKGAGRDRLLLELELSVGTQRPGYGGESEGRIL